METITTVARPTEDAAKRVGFAPGTFNNLRVYGGGPPYVKAGRKVLYRDSDVDAWLDQRVRRSTSEPAR
jgi:predicted DNA-binding transcriptional regulator AlpA